MAITQIRIYIAGDRLVPRPVEVVEDDTRMRDLDVGLGHNVSTSPKIRGIVNENLHQRGRLDYTRLEG
jgi:hypothetical protein